MNNGGEPCTLVHTFCWLHSENEVAGVPTLNLST